MAKAKALTHRNPTFLKQAYSLGENIDLINDVREVPLGRPYIAFDAETGAFTVMINALGQPLRVRKFDNLMSAANCVSRI